MQKRARGRYGVGELEGAGCRDVKTNSGESILDRCSWKVDFHGVGGTVRWAVVVDMVERRARRRGRRGLLRGAMVVWWLILDYLLVGCEYICYRSANGSLRTGNGII